MRILVDTNVILDIFLDREPFVDDAGLIWKAHEEERLTAYVSAITPVNLFYIARKLKGHEIATRAVHRLVATLPVTTVNQSVLESGLLLGFEGFEDTVRHASAEAIRPRCHCNPKYRGLRQRAAGSICTKRFHQEASGDF